MMPDPRGASKDIANAPKGILVVVGGNEDKRHNLQVLRTIHSLARKPCVKIEVITTASEIPLEIGQVYEKAFAKIGCNELHLLHMNDRNMAEDPETLDRLNKADIIFFTGGDQLRITSILGGTSVLRIVKERYFGGGVVIAGTSAGASAMSETMIYEGESNEAILKGTVHVTAGIGLISDVIIDSHFITRGRFSRLMQIACTNPGHIGLGLGEDTGVVIEKGHILKAIGSGLVVIFDGHHIRYSNITNIKDGEAIAVENVHIHTIVRGHGYDLLDRKYLRPQDMECLELVCP
jgi:cyanophycinase